MKSIYTRIVVGLAFVIMVAPAAGQDFKETLQAMAEDNAQGYIAPFATAFGTGMNTGTFHIAKPHKILGFDVKVNMGFVAIPEGDRTFDFIIPNFTQSLDILDNTYSLELDASGLYPQDRVTPNVFGGEADGGDFIPDRDFAYGDIMGQLSDAGLDTALTGLSGQVQGIVDLIPTIYRPGGPKLLKGICPVIVPQVSLGLPFGLEISLRGGIQQSISGFGDIAFMGFGGKLYINKFIPTIPIVFPALSVGYYQTNLEIGDIVSAQNSIATFQVSKSIPFFTVYGGFGLEKSSLDVEYTYIDDYTGIEVPIEFNKTGDNKFRTIVGARLKLALLSINADYNIGEYPAYNLGIGLTLR